MRQHRNQRQRQHDAHHRLERAVAGEAQQRHGDVNVDQNWELRRIDYLVGRRHHAGVAAGQVESRFFSSVLFVERLHRGDNASQRFRLVILEKHHHRQHAAVEIGEAGRCLHAPDRLRQHFAVERQHTPLEAALAVAGIDRARDTSQAHDIFHSLDVGQVPLETVEQLHRPVVHRAVFHRLGERDENIHAKIEIAGDRRAVAVVARVRPQLRHPLVEVANLHSLGLRKAKPKHHRANGNQRDRHFWPG